MNSTGKATRECPNRCGTTLPAGQYACRACWRILPSQLKTAITTTWTTGRFREHAAAKAAAQTWYHARDHPSNQTLRASR
jgi:hypothetical protein